MVCPFQVVVDGSIDFGQPSHLEESLHEGNGNRVAPIEASGMFVP